MPGIYERIIAFNENRLQDVVQLKYKAMSANVFSFYRGTCHLFYEDLSKNNHLPSSPATWVCGDLHLENFGSFKGDNHMVYFDLNDFDEGALAPAAWELARMVISIFVAFDSLGMEKTEALKAARLFLGSYSATLAKGKDISLDPRVAEGIVCTFLTVAENRRQKQLLKKGTIVKGGRRTLIRDARHLKIDKPLKKDLEQFVAGWIKTSHYAPFDFKVLDSVFRIAGTGSIGVKRYLFLLKSRNTKSKFLLLDMKQSMSSALAPYLQIKQPEWNSEGERVIAVQRRMQNVSPALLNAAIFDDTSFVLKQMQPMDDKINFELLKDRYDEINEVINDMAKLTASAQLRSGGREGSAIADEMIEFGTDDKWQDQVITYAKNYAKQVKKDYMEFMEKYSKA